jgi:hypothetical protein
MSQPLNQRLTAEVEGNFVLFLIGFRINQLWNIKAWLPVFRAMPKMLKELSQKPELGLLHYRLHLGFPGSMVIQYWRSLDQLQAYAHAANSAHLPAWRAFNTAIGTSGAVGIWHETYLIAPNQSENIYVNMPPFGLGQAGTLHEATGPRATAAKRLGL